MISLALHPHELAALGDGRLSQIRRPVEPQPGHRDNHEVDNGILLLCDGDHGKSEGCDYRPFATCPLGAPGDRLRVLEDWAHYQPVLEVHQSHVDGRVWTEISDGAAAYRADGFDTIEDCREHLLLMHDSCVAIEIRDDSWQPASTLPEWASRYFLENVGVRVERVSDIGAVCAMKEGHFASGPDGEPDDPRPEMRRWWNEAYPEHHWDMSQDGPWTWVVEVKKVSL